MTKPKKKPLPYYLQGRRKLHAGSFPPPFPLEGFAMQEWSRILTVAPWLEESDAFAIADRCVCAMRLMECELDIDDRRFVIPTRNGKIANPSVRIARSYRASLMHHDTELGLTPGSRLKLNDRATSSLPIPGSIADPLERALCGDMPPMKGKPSWKTATKN